MSGTPRGHDRAPGLFPELSRGTPPNAAGVLPFQAIRALVQTGRITAAAPVTDTQIQPASLDLRLGSVAYRLQASFLPGANAPVARKLDAVSMARLDLTRPTVLEKGCVYLAPLMESLRLPADLSAKANPKSTTGRLDLFTRLVTDYGSRFDHVPAGYSGPLFAEISPRTFSVIVHPGSSLSQLRFTRGDASSTDRQLAHLDRKESLVYLDEDNPVPADIQEGLKLSVSLKSDDGSGVVAYRGKKHPPLIDLARINHYDPGQFWDAITSCPDGLLLNPGDFYILGSRERVRVPPRYAAEMVPFDPSVGEFRIHYAGFFDPGFGYGDSGISGTRAVLEVRAHEVPFIVEHGQIVGRLEYTPLLDIPEKIYGLSIGSSYQRQDLALGKQFRRTTEAGRATAAVDPMAGAAAPS